MLQLIGDNSVWKNVDFKYVIYCSPLINEEPELANKLHEMCAEKNLHILDQIPSIEEINRFKRKTEEHCLLCLDDITLFKEDNKEFLQKLFLLYSHHNNLSVLYTVQNPFLQNKKTVDLVSLSRNLTARIILYQINDFYIYNLISSRIFPGKKNFLVNCLQKAKDKYKLNYVILNVNSFSDLPRRHICYSGIFQDERRRNFDSPIFFDLED